MQGQCSAGQGCRKESMMRWNDDEGKRVAPVNPSIWPGAGWCEELPYRPTNLLQDPSSGLLWINAPVLQLRAPGRVPETLEGFLAAVQEEVALAFRHVREPDDNLEPAL